MFTGLVEETGVVRKLERRRGSVLFFIEGKKTGKRLKKNDSVAVDGVCLSVIGRRGKTFCVQAVEETLKKTVLGGLQQGALVNLERPLLPTSLLGGHFVLGHVDGVGFVKDVETRRSSWVFWIQVPSRFRCLLIPAGSIAVNGVSLTVADLKDGRFAVSIIPHTWRMTTFRLLRRGDGVNLEFDVLGKYVSRLLTVGKKRT